MIRILVVLCGFALAAAGAVRMHGETRYLHRAAQSIAALLESEGTAGVIFVFQPEDCLSNGELIERWNRLHASGTLPVKGMVVGSRISPRQRDLFARNDLRLPLGTLSARDAAIIAEKLGYARTPFAVVLDARGRVAGAFPADRNVPADVLLRIARGD